LRVDIILEPFFDVFVHVSLNIIQNTK